MFDEMYMNNIVKGLFLLFLAVSGNFVTETLGCRTQQMLSNNMFAKHLAIFCILYFTIGFASGDKAPQHPSEIFKMCGIIYVLFLLFTKMDMIFTTIAIGLLTGSYVNYTFINYCEQVTPKDKTRIEYHKKIQHMLYIFILGVILVGFGLYYMKQRKEHYKTWSNTAFLFGVNKCDSLQ